MRPKAVAPAVLFHYFIMARLVTEITTFTAPDGYRNSPGFDYLPTALSNTNAPGLIG